MNELNDNLIDIRLKLLKWGKHNYRNFNWRKSNNPFHILIAEMMLHRTKSEQVAKIYDIFISKYPTPYILSETSDTDLKSDLYSLGLKWRIFNFKKSAKKIIQDYEGKIPQSKGDLKNLPGVGDYIAGAVLCIAYQKKSPLLDANIVRVISRLFGYPINDNSRRSEKYLKIIDLLMPEYDPGQFLFALLDFSAIICKKRDPSCDLCPIKIHCNHVKKI